MKTGGQHRCYPGQPNLAILVALRTTSIFFLIFKACSHRNNNRFSNISHLVFLCGQFTFKVFFLIFIRISWNWLYIILMFCSVVFIVESNFTNFLFTVWSCFTAKGFSALSFYFQDMNSCECGSETAENMNLWDMPYAILSQICDDINIVPGLVDKLIATQDNTIYKLR